MIRKFRSSSVAQTQRLGKKLGRLLKAGDTVLLLANLGAGKTTFVQGVAQSLGIKEATLSPTFILAQTLDGKIPLHHLDFYRLTKKEILDIGIQDYLMGGGEIPAGIVMIEWAERCPNVWPADRLAIEIKIDRKTTDRFITIKSQGKRSGEILKKI